MDKMAASFVIRDILWIYNWISEIVYESQAIVYPSSHVNLISCFIGKGWHSLYPVFVLGQNTKNVQLVKVQMRIVIVYHNQYF